jgi:hypothetical protein
LESMSDARHKKSPPNEESEKVTDTFRKEARRALELNKESNELRGLRKGAESYRISSQAELADALGTSKRMVSRIIGGVRAETEIDLVDDSVFVGPIRRLLELAPITSISVRTTRAPVVRFIAELPDDQFKVFEEAVRRQMRKSEG